MKDYFVRIFAYDHWANREVLHALREITAPPVRAVELLGHLLVSQEFVLEALEGRFAESLLARTDPDLAECAALADSLAARWRDYFERQSAGSLVAMIAMRNSRGEAVERYVPDLLTHALHHSAYHRGQIALRIREAGGDPPCTDVAVYARAFPKA